MLGVLCCTGIFSLVETRGWCPWTSHCGDFSCCWALALGTWVSAVAAHGLSSCGSPTLEHWLSNCGAQLSCSMGCGILSDQGSNPCLLHWQADSLPLSHQRSPVLLFQTDYYLLGSPLNTEDTSNPTKSKSQHPKQKHKPWPRRTWICCSGNRHRKYIWEWGQEGVESPKQEGGSTLLLEEKERDDLDCFSRLG